MFLRLSNVKRTERSVKSNCGQIWIDADFWFCVLAAAGVAGAFLLNQAITMAGRKKRRKREVAQSASKPDHTRPLIGTRKRIRICSE